MSTDPGNRKASLIEVFKAVGAIVALPLALFVLSNSIVAQPLIALVVALITAVVASAWVVCSGWTGITEVIFAWLALIVVVLAGFVIWPKTMTVEGIIRDTAGNPVSNEEVVLFDLSGRRYEIQTNAEGHYQFIDVPTGKYRVQVGGTEVEGEIEGFLVRKVQQSITVCEISATASPTPTPSSMCRITEPADGDENLGYENEVRATCSDVSHTLYIWILVYSHRDSKYYPQSEPIGRGSGDYEGTAYLGEPTGGIGDEFDIIVALADEAVSLELRQAAESFSGYITLPDRVEGEDSITVTRGH